jgi:hypothetical protein
MEKGINPFARVGPVAKASKLFSNPMTAAEERADWLPRSAAVGVKDLFFLG